MSERSCPIRPLRAPRGLRTAASSRAAPHGQRREPPRFGGRGRRGRFRPAALCPGGGECGRGSCAICSSAGGPPRSGSFPGRVRLLRVSPVPSAAVGFRPLPAALRPVGHGGAPGRAWVAPVPGGPAGRARSCPAAAAPERPRGRAALLGSHLRALRAPQTCAWTASRGAASGRGGQQLSVPGRPAGLSPSPAAAK